MKIMKNMKNINLKELTISNVFYYLQGTINWFLFKKYIKRYNDRVRACLTCAHHGSCIYCGCDFDKMAVSNKKCEQWQG